MATAHDHTMQILDTFGIYIPLGWLALSRLPAGIATTSAALLCGHELLLQFYTRYLGRSVSVVDCSCRLVVVFGVSCW